MIQATLLSDGPNIDLLKIRGSLADMIDNKLAAYLHAHTTDASYWESGSRWRRGCCCWHGGFDLPRCLWRKPGWVAAVERAVVDTLDSKAIASFSGSQPLQSRPFGNDKNAALAYTADQCPPKSAPLGQNNPAQGKAA